jgi:hypothetical protein
LIWGIGDKRYRDINRRKESKIERAKQGERARREGEQIRAEERVKKCRADE